MIAYEEGHTIAPFTLGVTECIQSLTIGSAVTGKGERTMPDRETAITHLQIIHTWATFARKRDLQFFTPKHLEDIAQWSDDALELLKEQEAVEPVTDQLRNRRCPKCNTILKGRYCHECGQAVK